MNSQLNKFLAQNRTVNYERFPAEYFSGGDIKIYFKDVFLDECTSLQFSLTEQLMPVYGYNSHTFDDVLRGSRIIQGSFRINFKDRGYLSGLLDHILTGDQEMLKEDVRKNEKIMAEDVDKLYMYAEEGWSREFDFMSQKFEDAIWKQETPQTQPRTNNTFFPDSKDGFDITITYGPYQDVNYTNVERNYQSFVNKGTVKAVYGVQLQSVSQLLDLSGQPVQEEYTFIAKDLDKE